MPANFHREQPSRRLAAASLARFREIVAQLFVEVAAPLALPNQSHKVWVEDIREVGHGMGERIALHDDVVHLQQGAFQNSASLLLRRGGEELRKGYWPLSSNAVNVCTISRNRVSLTRLLIECLLWDARFGGATPHRQQLF
jgi:hypothetical protein